MISDEPCFSEVILQKIIMVSSYLKAKVQVNVVICCHLTCTFCCCREYVLLLCNVNTYSLENYMNHESLTFPETLSSLLRHNSANVLCQTIAKHSAKIPQNTPPKYRKSLRQNTANYSVKMPQITSNPFTN